MAETIFRKILDGEIPADVVYEDERVMAFRDIAPQAPLHVLVIPREEIQTLNDLQREHDELVGYMVRVATRIAHSEGVDEDGYRLVINCNDAGGQQVPHLHIHLLAGRQMNWPPG